MVTEQRKRDVMTRNFLGGLAWGLGSVIGATVIVAILVGLLSAIDFIPFVGNFIEDIVEVVNKNSR
ncbi:hypothetical protein A3C59_00145 [Candidatus Daviesbacteria bacterium RIFCSPHIGHO2_02_FULL_36_13]|uniref:Uncharacterized protein n=1 Tax=Candidatus Daviesbacteria bacterium RIFCSPHIGHO2_02_FULL_36_13 TaxID=1797768 RepID=A0A1F5JYD4_9BACT|nr:MAG: hypothetical protein A3C59_00145 [Candidatus Daviesbacteria bacterium RIFCSPHIGHO2_02_FULL_36_13]OGE42124.1 MAG: hypothetical protein A3A45_00540 [Candidatus Daviesbacteria bacterium RIFCSPLOWO2_01_FULL_36_8]